MTAEEIYQWVQSANVTLAFDTSVTMRGGFLDLCDLANRVNSRREKHNIPIRVGLCVPAVAHTERLFDLARERGKDYDLERVRTILHERQIIVPGYTVKDAEHCAELLSRQYGTGNEWNAFKKRRCLDCVGLSLEYHDRAKGTGQQCGSPNDWLIIAQASQGKMLLVMDDQGRAGEYDLVERKARYSEVRGTLKDVFAELAALDNKRN